MFAIIHLSFLFHLSKTLNCKTFNILPLWITAGITPLYFILPFEKAGLNLSKTTVNSLFFFVGTYATIALHQWILNVVLCASAIGYLGATISNRTKLIQPFLPAIYAGCFAGMANIIYFKAHYFPWEVTTVIASIVGGIILSLLDKSLIGFGGILGSIGFGSVFIISAFGSDTINPIIYTTRIPISETAIIFGVASLGAVSTHYLSAKKNWNSIKASAFLAFIASSILYGVKTFQVDFIYPNMELLSFVFFGGTFVGMTSSHLFKFGKLIIATAVFSFLFIAFNPSFQSIGGALGTTACISVIFVHLASKLTKTLKK